MVPISGLFVLCVGMGVDLFAVSFGIKVDLERVFRYPTFKARTRPRRTLEERGFVVARPCMAAGAGLSDVAGKHQREIGRAIHLGRMETVVNAFALMDRHGFHRR